MNRILILILLTLTTKMAWADYEPKRVLEVRTEAFRAMQQCMKTLKPKERVLPSTCTYMDCDIKVRSCWIEGAQVVEAETGAIQKYVETTHMRDGCERTFSEFFDFPTPQEYYALRKDIRGEDYEWEVPPRLRGDAAILNRLATYELVLKLYNTECR